VGAYDAVVRGNYVHDDTGGSMDVGIFAKGGSERVLFDGNRIEHIASPFAALEIGGDTEWYNTRYTAAAFSYDINTQILGAGQTGLTNLIDDSATYDPALMAECRDCVARNNIIVDADPAISLRNAYNARVYHNTAVDCGWTQRWVKLWDDGNHNHPNRGIWMHNNLFSNTAVSPGSTVYQVRDGVGFPSNLEGFRADNNLFHYAGAAVTANIPGADAHSLSADPLLGGGYTPAAGSPALNAGIDIRAEGILPAGETSTDFDGRARPGGSGYDIGAFEPDGAAAPDRTAPAVPSGLTVE
jgi:hypothetical protein